MSQLTRHDVGTVADGRLCAIAAEINAAQEAGEAAYRRCAEKAIEIGERLIEAKQLVRHGAWAMWLNDNVGFSERTARRYTEAAKKGLDPATVAETGLVRSLDAASGRLPAVALNTGDFEWYTPEHVLEAARDVLGGIDLDPASCEIAQRLVRAQTFFTLADDGLTQHWRGRVWMNPPYAAPLISKFVERLVEHYECGEVTAAITLTNNATEVGWFRHLTSVASAVCFPSKRLRFLKEVDGELVDPGAALQGQAIAYLGPEPETFCERFEEVGRCWVRP